VFIEVIIMGRRILVSVLSTLLATSPVLVSAGTMTKVLPEGTRVYFRLDQVVSGNRFEVAYTENGERTAVETILIIQM
jgi:hypothetical protein